MKIKEPYKLARTVVFLIGSAIFVFGIASRNLELFIGGLFIKVVALIIGAIGDLSTRLREYRRATMPSGHCRNCGYNLKGNESGVCSECGEPISG